mgnify:CR=1 FL=1
MHPGQKLIVDAAIMALNQQSEMERKAAMYNELLALVKCLVDNEPDDGAADGGITVYDVWLVDAKRAIAKADQSSNDMGVK